MSLHNNLHNDPVNSQRKIAIIGAGLVGASAAYAFRHAGFQVDLYSDKSIAALRDSVPATGTGVYFGASRADDARIIEDLYPEAPLSTGMATKIVTGKEENLTTVWEFDANFAYTAQAVDVRLRATDRITKFIELGGGFHVQPVDAEQLDAIAAQADLTLVASGKGGLADLFPIDENRTAYQQPQRYLLTITATGLGHGPEVFSTRSAAGGAHNLFSAHGDLGELWWGPYYHKDAGPSWSCVGFALPGSALEEAFRSVTDARSALDVTKNFHRQFFPEAFDDLNKLQPIPADPYSWLKGAVTPVVRQPYSYTKNGHIITALGDTAIALDPIAGQGAQLGITQVAYLLEAASGYQWSFDENWVSQRFEEHWLRRAHASVEITRAFLNDPAYDFFTPHIFQAANTSPAVGTALFHLFSQPQPITGIHDDNDTAAFILDAQTRFASPSLA